MNVLCKGIQNKIGDETSSNNSFSLEREGELRRPWKNVSLFVSFRGWGTQLAVHFKYVMDRPYLQDTVLDCENHLNKFCSALLKNEKVITFLVLILLVEQQLYFGFFMHKA